MDALFTAAEISQAAGGVWSDPPAPEIKLQITTDTRTDNRGKIFFALRGEKFDAHDFLPQAISSGCTAICISQNNIPEIPPGYPVLHVQDTLKAFQSCAAFHRNRFQALTVLGVTGSVGKTSVKEMLKSICIAASDENSVLATIGNTNNHIGVAQNLLRLNSQHRFAVLELGTSSPGEIASLAAMIKPHGAIVNSIAPCHLEKLLSLEGVAAEKGTVFHALAANGAAVFPAECAGNAILHQLAGNKKTLTFGMNGKGDFSSFWSNGTLEGSVFSLTFPDGRNFEIKWHLTGEHNAINAAGAAALAYSIGISPEIIIKALPHTTLPGMRMKRSVIDGVIYLNDAYNANPASMTASLKMLADSTFSGKLLLILGGMKELGETSEKSHRELLELQKKLLPDALTITFGKEFSGLSELHFENAENAADFLLANVHPGDTVFAKGSRGNAVEKILPPGAR